MAFIYEMLYRSDNLANVQFEDYVSHLVDHLFRSYGARQTRVECVIDVQPVPLDIDTIIPLGLIINELVSNSFKHAFPDDREGHITVEVSSLDDKGNLAVSDDGIGLPADFDLKNPPTLGMQLVMALVDQLHGAIKVDRTIGTRIEISFSLQA